MRLFCSLGALGVDVVLKIYRIVSVVSECNGEVCSRILCSLEMFGLSGRVNGESDSGCACRNLPFAALLPMGGGAVTHCRTEVSYCRGSSD